MARSILLLLTLISSSALAQELVRGILVDSATFVPLAYASIQVKNKIHGTTTDAKGNFSIAAEPTDTLVISLLGYQRLEFPLMGYEPSLILLAERATLLQSITIDENRMEDPYAGMFDEQNLARLKKGIPFYYRRARKDKIKAERWREESLHVQTYVDVVINNPATKAGMMKKYGLSESEYYRILTAFNEKHYQVMYFLTAAELSSLLNRFFEMNTQK